MQDLTPRDMLIIPAIDMRDGKVVRLSGGDFAKETIYDLDPVAVAKKWEADGAQFLHIVDLDGAKEGKPVNFSLAASIAQNVSIPVETGGGIRDKATIRRFLDAGIRLVILGTRACSDPEFLMEACAEFGESVAVSVDSSGGKAAVEGWVKITSTNALELIKKAEKSGIRNIIFTDINKDGLMRGINMKNIKEVLDTVTVPVTVAGGISSLEDIRNLKQLASPKLRGAIIGKALYTGAIRLKEAIEIGSLSP
jgi:phosphoribosylformimino-5-aminoimidazole carboxamide ribotide isomerase